MNGPALQTTMASNLNLFNTEIGIDLLLDPADYISVLLARDGLFEVPETELITRIVRMQDTCIDAGSQVGYYSCLFAKLVGERGRVYSFDANPQACQSTRRNLALNGSYSAEVIHAALTDCNGRVPFHISSNDQTGLSSLAPIPTCKESVSVPSLRLEAFLKERRINRVRLLKIDVEGAEEMVLEGLGHFLSDHTIDYILMECFDERLRLLNSSTEAVAGILKSAGYTAWEYGTQKADGWSQAAEVCSRGDCNYLFTSPEVTSSVPSFSLAPALNQLVTERSELRRENATSRENIDKLHNDIDWLLNSIKAREEELTAAKWQLEMVLNSAGWRALNVCRRLREQLAPPGSARRRLCDAVLRNGKGRSR